MLRNGETIGDIDGPDSDMPDLKPTPNLALITTEQKEADEKQQNMHRNHIASIGNFFLSLLNMTAIFMKILRDDWRAMAPHMFSYVAFSLAAVSEVAGAFFSIRNARLDTNKSTGQAKSKNIADAVISTLAAAGTVVAVVGGFALAGVFAAVSPIIFAAIAGVRTVYNTIMSVKFLIQAHRAKKSNDPDENGKYDKYIAQAKMRAVHALIAALFTAAIITVMVFGMFAFAPLAVAASVIGIGVCVYAATKRANANAAAPQRGVMNEAEPRVRSIRSSTATAHNSLGVTQTRQDEVLPQESDKEDSVEEADPRRPLITTTAPEATETAGSRLSV